MWTLGIEDHPPVLQPLGFFGDRRRRSALDLPGNVAMHPLMSAILLRMAGHDPLQPDAQTQPPGRKPGQTSRAGQGSKRTAVVGPDDRRQAVTLEYLDKCLAHSFRTPPCHRPQAEDVSAVKVPDTQRLTAFAVFGTPPAFEVHGPDIIGPAGTS